MLYTIDTRNDLMDRLGFDPPERLDAREHQQAQARAVQMESYRLARRVYSLQARWHFREVIAPAARAGVFAAEPERAANLDRAVAAIAAMLDDPDAWGVAHWTGDLSALRRRAEIAADTARTAWCGV